MFTRKKTQEWYVKYLRDWAMALNVYDIADKLLSNPEFLNCCGSLDNKHHSWQGGLLEHTYEVFSLCAGNFSLYEGQINQKVVYLSALFHDYGKLWDYANLYMGDVIASVGTSHKRNIHHISRSAIEWEKEAEKFNIDEETKHKVTHCILSHHGLREFGSPVFPKTKEAWLLHLSDNLSARMDDCERIDLVNG